MTTIFSLLHQVVLTFSLVYAFRLRNVSYFSVSSRMKDSLVGLIFAVILTLFFLFPINFPNQTVSSATIVLAMIAYFCDWYIATIALIFGLLMVYAGNQPPIEPTLFLSQTITWVSSATIGIGFQQYQRRQNLRKIQPFIFMGLGLLMAIVTVFWEFAFIHEINFIYFLANPLLALFIAYLFLHEIPIISAKTPVTAPENIQRSLEIHDHLTQIMFSANTMIANMPRLFDKKPEKINTYLQDLKQLTDNVMADLQLLLFELKPSILGQTELSVLLKYLGDSVQSSERIKIKHITLDKIMLDENQHQYIYRIVQEALMNAVNHAQATEIEIKLMRLNDNFEVTISDNGIGFNSGLQSDEQSGLQSMRRYARLINATLEITSRAGDGTIIKLRG